MTEFELAELLLHRMEISSEFASMYLTLVSAYLVVSYLVGDKLSTAQFVIISTLYILWVIGLINGMYNNVQESRTIYAELVRLNPDALNRSTRAASGAGMGFVLVQVGGLLASLYFMWSVRHKKHE
ncbi:hypothetical protein [Haliea sp. E17]|uniref:hypothetical protein n=1 Tax=Haliea sp. E17 TaxID=3401576 RepID=UPI003AABE11D